MKTKLLPKHLYGGPAQVQNNESLQEVMFNGPNKQRNISDGLDVAANTLITVAPIGWGAGAYAKGAAGAAKYAKHFRWAARRGDLLGMYLSRAAADKAWGEGAKKALLSPFLSGMNWSIYNSPSWNQESNETNEIKEKQNKKRSK